MYILISLLLDHFYVHLHLELLSFIYKLGCRVEINCYLLLLEHIRVMAVFVSGVNAIEKIFYTLMRVCTYKINSN